MDTAGTPDSKSGTRKKRAFSLVVLVSVGLVALWTWASLSLDTSAKEGSKGGLQPPPGTSSAPDCGLDWAVVSSPSPPGVDINYLNGVAAVGTNDVWAVGYYIYNNQGPIDTLIEHWDGSAWSIVPSPNQGTFDNYLAAVSAVSANDVWAVGLYNDGTLDRTLTEHWDGTTWNIVASPNQGPSYSELAGVAAVGTNDVWAVGLYSNGSAQRTLTEHWDGSAWRIVASPNQGIRDNGFEAVSAVGTNNVWAVGFYYNSNGYLRTLTERWNGSTWSIVASANPGMYYNQLYGVAAVSANDVWAVGTYYDTNGVHLTLTEHWNGSAWTSVTSPNHGTARNDLHGVAAVSANDVWAVGDYNSASGYAEGRTLIQHWDGSSWQVVYSPSPSVNQDHFLYAVDALSADDVWAVGNYSSKPLATLIERYNPCTGTPTPVPTACPIQYTDVAAGSTFYDYVRCLACRGIVSGYNTSPPCTTGTPCFLPGNDVIRGQMAKYISNAANYQDVIPPNQQTFTDVAPQSVFWAYVERVNMHGVVNGYTNPARCPTGVPCFLPFNNVTRGQAARFISRAANYQDAIPPAQQSFTDVPPSHTFWVDIERVYMHGIVSGYQNSPPCTTGTPCYQPGKNVSRGQTAKFVSKAFIPDCSTPFR